MADMYFICPSVFFVFTIAFSLSINKKIPEWIDVDFGQIQAKELKSQLNK